MEDLLRTLSDYQIEAMGKGINFDLDVYYNSEKVPSVDVKMSYSLAQSGFAEARNLNVTFSENMVKDKRNHRINAIVNFIQSI